VDADNYTTKPSALLEFTYNDNNEIAGSNLINTGNESTLVGQSFDAATNTWRGNTSGTAVFYGAWTGARTVSGASVSDGDFFASWTLSLNSLLLPIELIDFNVECIDNHKVIKWSTKSEVNNDHFVIQMSHDGIEFENVAVVAGAGNSTMQNDYEYIDFAHFENITYYRLVQIDFDGSESYSNIAAADPCNGNLSSVTINTSNNNVIDISYDALSASKYQVKIIDARGRLIIEPTVFQSQKGPNKHTIPIHHIDFGIYYIIIQNETERNFKKIILYDNY
ncbi:MAG: T9SS type A sorting domain-containing protein, partial [Crocinitomicaceae bacterium]|nr:T9SS type A sorting domain-containing protein [Crocinitomicaceae bacterium]